MNSIITIHIQWATYVCAQVTTHEEHNNHSHNIVPAEVRFCDSAYVNERFRPAVRRTDQKLHLFASVRKAQAQRQP